VRLPAGKEYDAGLLMTVKVVTDVTVLPDSVTAVLLVSVYGWYGTRLEESEAVTGETGLVEVDETGTVTVVESLVMTVEESPYGTGR